MTSEKGNYLAPELKIVRFSIDDIIITSAQEILPDENLGEDNVTEDNYDSEFDF